MQLGFGVLITNLGGWGVGLSKIFQLIFWGQGGGSADALKVI